MKILTAEEMREVDRLTIERGIPGLILMENAGSRVGDFLFVGKVTTVETDLSLPASYSLANSAASSPL